MSSPTGCLPAPCCVLGTGFSSQIPIFCRSCDESKRGSPLFGDEELALSNAQARNNNILNFGDISCVRYFSTVSQHRRRPVPLPPSVVMCFFRIRACAHLTLPPPTYFLSDLRNRGMNEILIPSTSTCRLRLRPCLAMKKMAAAAPSRGLKNFTKASSATRRSAVRKTQEKQRPAFCSDRRQGALCTVLIVNLVF